MKHDSKSKEEYYLSLNNLDNVDSKLLTEDEKISLNMIRSVDEEQELNDTNFVEKDIENEDGVAIEGNEGESGNFTRSIKKDDEIDIENGSGNEYEDDDDKLFLESGSTDTTESIISEIINIEVANENIKKEADIGIDWEKLDQLNKKDKSNGKKKNEKNTTTQEKIRVKRDNQ